MRWTIRDLLFVMAIVGLALGWLLEHRRHVAVEREYQRSYSALDGLIDILHEQGFRVEVGWESIRIANTRSPDAARWNGSQADYRNRDNPFDAIAINVQRAQPATGEARETVLDLTAVVLLATILFVVVLSLIVVVRLANSGRPTPNRGCPTAGPSAQRRASAND